MRLFFNSAFLSRFHKHQLYITILLKCISLKLFYYLDAIRLLDTTTSLETQHFLQNMDPSKRRCYLRTHCDFIYPQDGLQCRYILGDNPDWAKQRMNNLNDCFLRSSDFPCHVALYLRLCPQDGRMCFIASSRLLTMIFVQLLCACVAMQTAEFVPYSDVDFYSILEICCYAFKYWK